MVRDWVTTEQARHLRRNAPLVERMLRDRLKERQLGVKFRRQHPMNPYIVDFCSVAAKLVVEIDGPFHDPTKDQLRDRELSDRGYRTIRLSSIAVFKDLDAAVQEIERLLPGKDAGSAEPG